MELLKLHMICVAAGLVSTVKPANSQGEKQCAIRKPRFRLSKVLERFARKREGRNDNQNCGKYFNWFDNPHDWKKIESALKICQFSPRRSVAYLRLQYSKPGIRNPFLWLNESTIKGWLTPEKTLKPLVLELVRHPNFASEQFRHAITHGVEGFDPSVMQRALQRGPSNLGEFGPSAWSSRPELEEKFTVLLNKHQEAGAALNANTMQFLLKGFLSVHHLGILLEQGGPF
ncbi:hypothetical protein R1flu_023254 [Riccia fluitans]|uniref:Uncharacterized protein n=1 Tax=Riccia fluitans TaxID=41844 RepID=A0ABD1XRP4_9MARC